MLRTPPIALAVMAMSATMLQASIITNGSFEDDANNDLIPDGWTITGNVVRITADDTIAGYALDGDYFLLLNPGNSPPDGVIEQTLLTAVGAQYEVSFGILQRGLSAGSTVSQARASALDVDDLTVLGTVLGVDPRNNGPPPAPDNPDDYPYLIFTFQFTATDSATLLRIEDATTNNGNNAGLLLDHVQVEALSVPIPEPSSFVIAVGLVLCSAAGWWWKRGRRTAA